LLSLTGWRRGASASTLAPQDANAPASRAGAGHIMVVERSTFAMREAYASGVNQW
jgi:hypothetical protein